MWVILLALTGVSPAAAQSSTTGGPLYTVERAVAELGSTDASDQAYAARWLWMRAKALARRANRGGNGEGTMEALADFDDLRRLAVRPLQRCVVDSRRNRRNCADTLGLVGDERAIAPLQEGLAAEDRPKVQEHVQAAIDLLKADSASP